MRSHTVESGDRRLIALVDAQTGEAAAAAGPHLACHAGCAPCCFGPFAITQLDAWRLRKGLNDLTLTDPTRAAAVRRRAADAVGRQSAAFPADRVGTFATPAEERRFYEAFESDPCPALDPDRGTCVLYASRPICCRTHGPPAWIGGENVSPCPLCFETASPEEVEAARRIIDIDGDEDPLIDAVETLTGRQGMTTVAFAIASASVSETPR